MKTADIVIAGGGIIGLSTAVELASAGVRVRVLERGRAMCEASWAAAGMLAAHDPANPLALQALSELSLSLYPEFLRRIERLSGQQIPLRTSRTLQACLDGQNIPSHAGRRLDEATAREAVPGINSQGRQFFLLNEDSLDPRDLCLALPRAVVASGARLEEDSAVLGVKVHGDSVAVETTNGSIAAGAFLNCCGAWAGLLQSSTGSLSSEALGIEPRKGQLVTIKMPENKTYASNDLKVVLRTPEIYLVPRGDGRIVVGATVERAGFDKSVDDDAVQRLFVEACALWPPLAEGRVIDTWAGLRPGSIDSLPLMGNSGEEHLWMATGHFRNGILLAPATARIMRQLMAGERPEVVVEAFNPDRFASHEV